MKKRKQKIISKDFLSALCAYSLTLVISGIVGAMVALPFILPNTESSSILLIVKSSGVGAAIGLTGRFVFSLIYKNIHINTFWSFFSLILVIALGTFTGAVYLGEKNVLNIAIMIALAEAVGCAICVYVLRYSIRLNESLEKTKKLYKE